MCVRDEVLNKNVWDARKVWLERKAGAVRCGNYMVGENRSVQRGRKEAAQTAIGGRHARDRRLCVHHLAFDGVR